MSRMAIKVCLVLSASVQCRLRLSQKEWEREDCDDIVTASGEPKAVEDAVVASIGSPAEVCADVSTGASVNAARSMAECALCIMVMVVRV